MKFVEGFQLMSVTYKNPFHGGEVVRRSFNPHGGFYLLQFECLLRVTVQMTFLVAAILKVFTRLVHFYPGSHRFCCQQERNPDVLFAFSFILSAQPMLKHCLLCLRNVPSCPNQFDFSGPQFSCL